MADEPQEGRIILYQEDGRNVPVEVTYWRETFWLTQQKMAELFNVTVPTINEHLKNIFSSGELTETSTIRKSRIVRQEGSRQVSREISFYNLDAIIAVGYRVNSRQATQFRQWATGILREYIVKGFALNDDMLKNGRPFGDDYFEELLDRIRDEFSTEGFGPYAVERLSDGELLGFTGLHRVTFSGGLEGQVEILWRLRHDTWGQGYATEAARACIAHAAKLGIPELVAFTFVGNGRSRRVMQKLGMTCVGEFDHPALPEGHPLRRHALYRIRTEQ